MLRIFFGVVFESLLVSMPPRRTRTQNNDNEMARWCSVVTKEKISEAVTVTIGRRKFAPRPDQSDELRRWLTEDHDSEWLIVAPSGQPTHFISSDGKTNKLTLAVDERKLWFWASDGLVWYLK